MKPYVRIMTFKCYVSVWVVMWLLGAGEPYGLQTSVESDNSTLVASVGSTFKLPGYINTSTFSKDGKVVYISDSSYLVTATPFGYQVSIRFVTCTDQGSYTVGHESFTLRVTPGDLGALYYTARVFNNAAVIGPLSDILKISSFYVHSDRVTWGVVDLWNSTTIESRDVSRRGSGEPERLGRCCTVTRDGTTFVGYEDTHHKHFMYQRKENGLCSNLDAIHELPTLTMLDDANTSVKLLSVNESK